MKRILQVMFFASLLSIQSFAQYAISPNDTLERTLPFYSLTYDSIHLANTSGGKLNLGWKLVTYDTLNGTYFDFCASGNCWLGVPDSGSFPMIDPGDFGWAGFHFWVGSSTATARTRIYVYDKDNLSSSGDTLTIILNAVSGNGVNNISLENQIFVGPNPTKGIIEISSKSIPINAVEVFNLVGERVYYSKLDFNNAILNLTALNDGIYFTTFHSGNSIITKKIIINK